jgi:hypothetical protein
MNHKLGTKSTTVCHLMRFPRELRDQIYRVLLTTAYGANLDPKGYSLKFELHPAILRVSKQISVEASGVLYQENEFVVFKVIGLSLLHQWIPQFNRLRESQIPRTLLRVELAMVDSSRVAVGNTRTIVTTAEGIRSIISAIWVLENHSSPTSNFKVDHADLRLTLDFHLKVQARYEHLSNLVLAPWSLVNGLKELKLTGDIDDTMQNQLQKFNYGGPCLNKVASHILECHKLADLAFNDKDDSAARWWYTTLNQYWIYLYNFRPHRYGGETMCEVDQPYRDFLRKMLPKYFEGSLNLVRTCLRQMEYSDAALFADAALYATKRDVGWANYLGYDIPPAMWRKFHLAVIFTQDKKLLHIDPETLEEIRETPSEG